MGSKYRPASHLLKHIRGGEGRLPKAGRSKHRRERGHNYAQDRVLVEEDCVSQQLVGGREGTLPGV